MKYLNFALGFLFVITITSCGNSPTCVSCGNQYSMISGKVLYTDSGRPAEGASVYLKSIYRPDIHHSALTDKHGSFHFRNVAKGSYRLYAGIYNVPGTSFSYVSPFSDIISCDGQDDYYVGDVLLNEVFGQSTLAGQVVYADSGTTADSTDVLLYKLVGVFYTVVESVLTNDNGRYSFQNVETGNYIISARRQIAPSHSLMDEIGPLYCDGKISYAMVLLELTEPTVKKPAIYIYPRKDGYFQVQLGLNNGTLLTESIPEYGSGWYVFVEKSGRIDHQYDHLFYEAALEIIPELSNGWCIFRDDLETELHAILLQIGLNKKEAGDFLSYWLDQLQEHQYYQVLPIFDQSLNGMVDLRVVPQPDIMLRFWMFFKGNDEFIWLPTPQLPGFHRGATTVVEWGGVLLN